MRQIPIDCWTGMCELEAWVEAMSTYQMHEKSQPIPAA